MIIWVVDVQKDFMEPTGRLYVHDLFHEGDAGARVITGQLERAVREFRARGAHLVYTGDWHRDDDAEIDPVAPDASKGTYPPHCMGASADPLLREGAELVREAGIVNPIRLRREGGDGRAVALELVRGRDVFIEKSRFSVFEGNAQTDRFVGALRELGETEVIVCGVARDVCVTQAVEGLSERGMHVTVLSDVQWGLGLEPAADTFDRWRRLGVQVASLDEVLVRGQEGRIEELEGDVRTLLGVIEGLSDQQAMPDDGWKEKVEPIAKKVRTR